MAKKNRKRSENDRSNKKTRANKSHGVMSVPLALKGLTVVITGIVLTLLVRGFYPIWIGEIVAIAVSIIGWIIVLVASVKMKDISTQFKYLNIVAIVGLVSKIAELGLGTYNHISGFQAMAYVELEVVALAYVSVLSLLLSYSLVARGMAFFATGEAQAIIETKWGSKIKIFSIIVMLMLIIIPLSGGFPIYIEIPVMIIMFLVFMLNFTKTTAFIRKEYYFIIGKYPNFLRGKDFVTLDKKVKKNKKRKKQ